MSRAPQRRSGAQERLQFRLLRPEDLPQLKVGGGMRLLAQPPGL